MTVLDHFQTDDHASPLEREAHRFAHWAMAALEGCERIELPSLVLVRVEGGFKIEKKG